MFRFVSFFFSFVSAYLGLESTNCINVLLHEPVSISVNSGTTVNVLIDAKMLVSKMRPKTVQNSKRCKDARIQDAKMPVSKMQRCLHLRCKDARIFLSFQKWWFFLGKITKIPKDAEMPVSKMQRCLHLRCRDARIFLSPPIWLRCREFWTKIMVFRV